MKYLRLYENHNQYYQKINIDQFRNDIRRSVCFDHDSVTNLKNLFNISDKNIDFDLDCYIMINTKKYGIDIFMLEDEWYKVSLLRFKNSNDIGYQEFYLCDQWEGLINLLKDKNIIQ
jgi:hypothetical protein